MILHYNILIIKRIKHQSYFWENMYVFFKNMYENSRKHVRVLGNK